jgi:hypothetical protein
MKKHATQTAAELKKLLNVIGTKNARKGDIVAWYRTDHGLALGVRIGGVQLIAGEAHTMDAIENGLAPTRMARCGQVDALLGAGAEPVQAYQAADPDTGGELSPRKEAAPVVAQLGLASGVMLDGLAWCAKATATDQARLIMTSVHVQLVGGAARLVGADNYRLHIVGAEATKKADYTVGVPRRVAQYLAARGESVRLDYHATTGDKANGATIRSAGLIVRIQEGETRFPDFASVVPRQEEAAGSARVRPSELLEATKAAAKEATLAEALEGGRVSDTLILTLAAGDGGVMVAAQVAHLVASTYGTGKEAAAINADYLTEALEGFPQDELHLALAAQDRPIVLRAYDRAAVVMPIRAKDGAIMDRISTLRDLVGQAHAVEATA